MPYDYNRYRRKRIQSEQQLMQQMMQTVLNDTSGDAVSGAYFAYDKYIWSKTNDAATPNINPVITVRPGTWSYTTISGGPTLAVSPTTGVIKLNLCDVGEYMLTIDIGPGTTGDNIKPGKPGGTYSQKIVIRG